ncbi:MAG: hypothetical protein LQ338_003955 [Usnochroma carphineum]|nr:MAG: hypothetical protein LQ338_003955 [Usnochroma carphineum]
MGPDIVPVTTSKADSRQDFRKLPLSHNNADSRASALRLVLTLFPDWEKSDGNIEFVRFKEGITNTLLKAVKRRPGYTEEQIDEEAVLIRAYGKGTDVLIDRERESQSHSLLCKHGLAPELLARFQNGLMYKFIRGQVCEPHDLTQQRIWRGVARRLAEWHARLPVLPASESTVTNGLDTPPEPFAEAMSQQRPSTEVINSITPRMMTPNVWTVMQKWIFALPTASEAERQRKETLQKELERTVAGLGEKCVMGKDGAGLVLAHCDLLSGNIIVHRHEPQMAPPPVETVSFIDYEYATPAPAAFDLANHFAEWGGFECDYGALPTRSVRRAFIEEYVRCYDSHSPLPPHKTQSDFVDRLFEEVDVYRGVPGLYWGIWALIQATISQIDFDYASYAEVRLQEYWDWRAEEEGTREKEGRELPLRERRWNEE